MISINSNNKFSVISVEKWEEYQVEELNNNNKITTEEQQSNTNKNVKNIYITLFNKYKDEIEKESANRKYIIISECRKCKEYSLLTDKEQDKLFYELMSIEKKYK